MYYPASSIEGSKLHNRQFEIGKIVDTKEEEKKENIFAEFVWDKTHQDSDENRKLCKAAWEEALPKQGIDAVILDANEFNDKTKIFKFNGEESSKYLALGPGITNCPDFLICDKALDVKKLMKCMKNMMQVKPEEMN